MKRKTVEAGRALPDQLLALAAGVAGVSNTEAAKSLGMANITIYNVLAKMHDKGDIERVRTDVGLRYCLPGKSAAVLEAISDGEHEPEARQDQRVVPAKPGQYVKMPGHVRSVFELGA